MVTLNLPMDVSQVQRHLTAGRAGGPIPASQEAQLEHNISRRGGSGKGGFTCISGIEVYLFSVICSSRRRRKRELR
jgi:hypothetical protein